MAQFLAHLNRVDPLWASPVSRPTKMKYALLAYHQTHWLGAWDRAQFDDVGNHSRQARDDLDSAAGKLATAWRDYRLSMNDRGIVMITQQHRVLKFQKQTFYELAYGRDGRRTNVYEQLCTLNIMKTAVRSSKSGFEQSLIMVIAKYLLPSEEQHGMYYGFRGSRSAHIDLTFEQPTIDGVICTKAEHYAHNNPVIHADDLLDEGWDYSSGDDEEWVA